MHRTTPKQRYEFIQLIYEHSPHQWQGADPPMFIQRCAEKIMRYGATLGRLAEELCNGYQDCQGNWDQERTQAAERKQERIEAKTQATATEIGGRCLFQGDPRGATVKIIFPDGYTNDWGHTGICVPTS